RGHPPVRRSALERWIGCAFFVLLSPALLSAAEPPASLPQPLPLAWCLERASRINPDVAAETATADAARHRIAPAGALEDPRLSYEASNVPRDDLDFDSTPLSGHQLRLAQKLPFPGLLSNREDAARAAADAASAGLEARIDHVAGRVERAWAELGFVQRALEITDRNLVFLRQFARIAETKYGVGSGRQQDVLRAQVELTVLLQDRLRRVASLRSAEASLASLLDLPPHTVFPRTEDLAEAAPLPDLDALLARLEGSIPLLRAMASHVEEAERLRKAARFEGYPDFDVALGYRIRKRVAGDPVAGDDFVSAGVTVRLPMNRTRWRAHVAEREALLHRARADYRGARARLRDALQTAHAQLARADGEGSLLETGLVPQARQSLESSRSGYEVDRVDFLSLVDSQVRLLNAELGLVRAMASRRSAFAELEAILGETLR
ncbi:MAG: TolC family protein, partial [Myxococcota bacterium]